jgi:hypothetical protein
MVTARDGCGQDLSKRDFTAENAESAEKCNWYFSAISAISAVKSLFDLI